MIFTITCGYVGNSVDYFGVKDGQSALIPENYISVRCARTCSPQVSAASLTWS